MIAVLQAGPSLFIVFADGLAGRFDWLGYTAYQLGSLVVPLLAGCAGLLLRRNPGLGYCIVALTVFVVAAFGSLTR